MRTELPTMPATVAPVPSPAEIEDLRGRYHAAAQRVADLNGQLTALTNDYNAEHLRASAALAAAPPLERAKAELAGNPFTQRGREAAYVEQYNALWQQRNAAHDERCRLEVELDLAELLARTAPAA